MASSPLSGSTQRRLLKLPFQANSIWEGDRLSLNFRDPGGLTEDLQENRDCILWVDGVNGVVRSMDMVPASTGQEAIVRTLLQAMEQPMDTPAQISRPSRPKKIVVRSRELQFFLRGVLQDLDIVVEYQPELPLIDEFFSGLQRMISNRLPPVPPQYADTLENTAHRLWNLGPWKQLADHQILRITLPNLEEQPQLYVSVLGKLGMEFGILFYRSLASLRTFRETIVDTDEPHEAFFRQDCFYITFNRPMDLEGTPPSPPVSLDWEDLDVEFGSIHPLEGMQPHLGEEEAEVVLFALEGFLRFIQKHQKTFENSQFPTLSNTFKLSFPRLFPPERGKIAVEVRTEPEIAEEMFALSSKAVLGFDDVDLDDLDLRSFFDRLDLNVPSFQIGDNLIPNGSIVSIGGLPWDLYEVLEQVACHKQTCHQQAGPVKHRKGDGLPSVVVQTTRPKAKAMVEYIQSVGGLAGISFAVEGLEDLELGLLKLGNGDLELFGEYELDDFVHQRTRKNWDQRLTQTKGMCALVLAGGAKGKRRGQPPSIEDIVMVLEAPYIQFEGTIIPSFGD